MRPITRAKTIILACAGTLVAPGAETLAATRTATWPRYAKPYEVVSYKYADTRPIVILEFEALAAPVQVPAAPGPPVVNTFCPPFAPNKITIKVRWNAPGQADHVTIFAVNIPAQGGAFTWEFPCLRDFFDAACCPQDPENQEYVCCSDPDFQCTGQCNGFVFTPSEVFGDPDGTDIPEAPPIPTVSQWGLIVLALLTLTAGTIVLRRGRLQVCSDQIRRFT